MQAHMGAEGDLWQGMVVAGCHAVVETATSPSVQRIMHIDAPVVLGRTVIQQSGAGLELTRQALEPLITTGVLEPLPLKPLTHLVWAMFFETYLYIARADDTPTAQKEMLAMLLRVFSGLRRRP